MIFRGKFNVLGVNITAGDYEYVISKIIEYSGEKKRLFIAPVASHPVVLSVFNNELKEVLNSFDLVLPDSQYVKWAMRFLYGVRLPDRVYGPRLFLDLCRKAEKDNLGISLVGNDIENLEMQLLKDFPKLRIEESFDLRGKDIKRGRNVSLIKKINYIKADILFIGIGSPAQYYLMDELNGLSIPVVGVGASFDFMSGLKRQAPVWMQKHGLEWLFRLYKEPKRLWKRYFIFGSIFIIIIFYAKFLALLNRSNDKIVKIVR